MTPTCASNPPFRAAFVLAAALLLFACSQGEGEPCQSNRDCENGLVCRIATTSERGTCTDPSADQAPRRDSGMDFDAAEPELPDEDAGTIPDDEDAG